MPEPLPQALRDRLFPDAVWPRYDGGSILNLAPTLGQWLGVEGGWAAAPLDRALQPGGRPGTERVVVLVLDGLGYRRLARHRGAGGGDALERLLARFDGRVERLTSVSPATTSVATTCLLGNGSAPGRSGMLGFRQRLPGPGVVANMLLWRPDGDREARVGDLERWGVVPEDFLSEPGLFQVLARGGVGGAAFLPARIRSSPLSRMQLRGVEVRGTLHPADLFAQLGEWLAATAGRRGVAYGYLTEFDSLSHRDGPQAPTWDALALSIVADLERAVAGWPAAARRGARLWITADHGLVQTPPENRTLAPALAPLRTLMCAPSGGEARHTYLYARPGAAGELRAAAGEALGEGFVVLDGQEALRAGLYGSPSALHPEASQRVGDAVILARGPHSLWLDDPDTVLHGMHGSLEPEEMEVPWMTLRLDA